MYLLPYNYRMLRPLETPRTAWEWSLLENVPLSVIPEMEVPASTWNPPVDFIEDKDRYLILVDAPGMKKEAIDVKFTDGILYIRGEREHGSEIGDGLPLTLERRCGSFARHFHLRSDILCDDIRADYLDGILKVVVPKSSKSVTKSIPIHVS